MIVGLTGGIGSGKSVVSKIFELFGCVIFNSDEEAKKLYFNDEIKKKVISLIGESAYSNSNELNKKYISEKIFSNTILLHKLNEIIHPAVGIKMKRFVELNPGKIIIKESALLFEAGLIKQCDKIIVVYADDDTRIRRVMQRDNLKREDVLNRINNQFVLNEKMKHSDFVISNNENEMVIPQVLKIMEEFKTFP